MICMSETTKIGIEGFTWEQLEIIRKILYYLVNLKKKWKIQVKEPTDGNKLTSF